MSLPIRYKGDDLTFRLTLQDSSGTVYTQEDYENILVYIYEEVSEKILAQYSLIIKENYNLIQVDENGLFVVLAGEDTINAKSDNIKIQISIIKNDIDIPDGDRTSTNVINAWRLISSKK